MTLKLHGPSSPSVSCADKPHANAALPVRGGVGDTCSSQNPPPTYPIDIGPAPQARRLTAVPLHRLQKMDLGILEVELQKFSSK